MEHPALFEHLALAETHVAEGERILARQRRLLAELERDGHDTRTARTLLQSFEQTQASHVAERDRLRAELSGPPPT
jgi:hypothetical protein